MYISLCYDWPSALSNDVGLIFEYFMVFVSQDQRAEQQGCLLPESPLNWPEEMYVSSMCFGYRDRKTARDFKICNLYSIATDNIEKDAFFCNLLLKV